MRAHTSHTSHHNTCSAVDGHEPRGERSGCFRIHGSRASLPAISKRQVSFGFPLLHCDSRGGKGRVSIQAGRGSGVSGPCRVDDSLKELEIFIETYFFHVIVHNHYILV